MTRLTSALDTVDNDGELVNAIHAIRQIGGPTWFTDMVARRTKIPLEHDEQEVVVRLRGLGFILRGANHPNADVQHALSRTCDALVLGQQVAHGDLMTMLACMRDLLVHAADHMGVSVPPPPLSSDAIRKIFRSKEMPDA